MTRNRNPNRDWREPRSRYDEHGSDRYGRYGRDHDRDERGWFERAGDEVASWFGDDDAERRRRTDSRDDRWSQPSRSYGDQPRYRDEGARRPYTGSYTNRDYGQDQGRSFENRFDRGASQRDFTGMAAGSAGGVHDPHYGEWRRRQIDALDRDYDEYRRENQSRFENEFSSWRNERQGKRQMLQSVREHMTVVGSDEEQIGTVDKVRGDNIVLTKNDSSDGRHHMLSCSLVDRVEGDRVILNRNADEARALCVDSDVRNRALFERDDDHRNEGPHILDRSFSGTY
ncbi:DUF2171 domain-containing protein [Sphingomonas rhizophila]|jgi:hypothetical protein|uniref:DUF2171 domain-containing protein n=1 Tax=Sphingomonas rhizophila TaxID=2071607 RepID=A0A7G9SC44_9SPHN|nr:DUF2171 domain-containing protein [Sphingomonas rhizophila]QNN65419.1 DUF2171 domain-containing protein [Sphingomonas rhizophila]